ncbi:hypothetical protein RR46_02628 [Papilio xuthus]|uniref:Uncharacterized protein n=1 Tax=Papilio xuthus TaxID=66420 RepID=A0A194Q3X6_PAPXU|nr:hypothetical protein RR46_02628 [Papilio xuthus]
MKVARNVTTQHRVIPVTLSKDMVGRASVEPGWPVDPGRSAGPAPHRPPTAPRGGITRTRAPGSTRAGDRLTRVVLLAASPARSPPRRFAATLQAAAHASGAPPTTRCGTPTPPSSVYALTHRATPLRYAATPLRRLFPRVRTHRTEARRFLATENKPSKAHPHVLNFALYAHAHPERLLTSPVPRLFSPGEVNTLTSIGPG